MSEVKWIKLDTDMFSNPKIKKIRRLPDGNNVLLLWIMLLTMAGKCNAGGMIHITENVLYTPEDLAEELNLPLDTVRLGLQSLEKLGMVLLEDGIEIKNWSYYQSVDGMEKIREQTRKRVAEHRERKALEEKEKCNVTSNVTVTQSSISISNSNSLSNSYSLSISNIVNYLNKVLGTNYKSNSKNTVKHITARLKEGYLEEEFYAVIDKKYYEWNGTEMQKYLVPDTLFGTKFEKYLNQTVVKGSAGVKKSELDEWKELKFDD